jgi:hypothetical protein
MPMAVLILLPLLLPTADSRPLQLSNSRPLEMSTEPTTTSLFSPVALLGEGLNAGGAFTRPASRSVTTARKKKQDRRKRTSSRQRHHHHVHHQ